MIEYLNYNTKIKEGLTSFVEARGIVQSADLKVCALFLCQQNINRWKQRTIQERKKQYQN